MTLLRDLINIPQQVNNSDFVVSLKDGWMAPERVVNDYVATKQLVSCFDAALGLVASAVTEQRSKGAYLHGSFGAGKSHFMSVLNQLLTDGAPARSLPEFGNLLGKHNERLLGQKFLMVPVHFIGGETMEQQILGGYVRYVARLHPDAPTPAVYVSDDIVANAVSLREAFGDDAFFAQLAGATTSGGWGAYDQWDAARFNAAVAAPGESDERRQLIEALLDTVLTSYADSAASTGVGYVPLERGLATISQHAHRLGYSGVVLFLDELILWFASRMSDQALVTREGSKVAKLVEAEHAERPVPIVSFIARQRDLRELVGDMPGAEEMNFSDILKWWEGRFSTISLEDRNLVEIAGKRVLKPVSEDARQQLSNSFDSVQRDVESQRHLDVMLGGKATVEQFRQLYPFNPALVDALVALSSALQRERTALKVMLQLLVDHRETLQLGQLVPLGDLFDVIAREADPFSEGMKAQFMNARRLWETRLGPMLASEHGIIDMADTANLARTHAWWAESRMLKSLLVAALVPETPALRGMTLSRLMALNHGTIRTPLPGTEQAQVLAKLVNWSSQIGELAIGEDLTDPTVSIHLSGIDLEPLLDQVSAHDSNGQRVFKARQLLESHLDLKTGSLPPITIDFVWRGSKRTADVVIGNVRDENDLPPAVFRAVGNVRLVIDLPLDPERGRLDPFDDLDRVANHRAGLGGHDSVVWLPNFLSAAAQTALGRLVKVEYLLAGDNLETNGSRLMSVDERAVAKQQLVGQRETLRRRLEMAYDRAYGLTTEPSVDIADSLVLSDQFQRLGDGTVSVEPPLGRTLRSAAEHLAGQLLTGRYPAHPEFGDTPPSPIDQRTALEWLGKLYDSDMGRVDGVPSTFRGPLRKVLNPLRLATMYENHLIDETFWADHFNQRIASEGPSPLTVGHLRKWLDDPTPRGLNASLGDFVIMAFCAKTNRSLRELGEPVVGELGKLSDGWTIEASELPDGDTWDRAVAHAEHLGVVALSPRLSATTAERLARDVSAQYGPIAAAASELLNELGKVSSRMGIDLSSAARTRTAEFSARVLTKLSPDALTTLRVLSDETVPTSWGAVGASCKQAAASAAALRTTNWQVIDGALELASEASRQLKVQLKELLEADEVARPLAVGLRSIENNASRLLIDATKVHQTSATSVTLAVAETEPSKAFDVHAALVELERIRDRLRREANVELAWEFKEIAP
jgi:hypothetical protein